jgi:phosphopentomutase
VNDSQLIWEAYDAAYPENHNNPDNYPKDVIERIIRILSTKHSEDKKWTAIEDLIRDAGMEGVSVGEIENLMYDAWQLKQITTEDQRALRDILYKVSEEIRDIA